MIEHAASDIVSLPFAAAARAASAPAPGPLRRPLGGVAGDAARSTGASTRSRRTAATVLVTGESGSGKELVARTIHDRSPRAGAPFVAVNCGAIPANLIEAELFGYEKGAFTGAARQHRGCFERAEGGTLFLDEITEMAPRDAGAAAARARDRPLPRGSAARTSCAHACASSRRPTAIRSRRCRDGQLREDLMYRLAVFPIALPPLREREGDAELLAEHFLAGS